MTHYRILSCLAALAAAALAVVVPVAPAQAHTDLTRTSPAADSTTTKPVTAVRLTFSGLVKQAGATVVVTGPDQVSYSDAAPAAVDKTVTQKVRPLPLGAIRVAWRVVSADGHPIQGSFTFINRAAPPSPSAAPSPPAGPGTVAPTAAPSPVTASATSTPAVARAGQQTSAMGIWWAAGGGLLVLALLGGLLWWRRRPPRAAGR